MCGDMLFTLAASVVQIQPLMQTVSHIQFFNIHMSAGTSVSRVPGKILIALPQTGTVNNFCGEPPLYPPLAL